MTGVLAVWGALLSTFLAGLQLLKFFEERVNVHVEVKRNMQVHPKDTEYGDKTYIIITASNRGRRTVFLEKAGLVVRRKSGKNAGGFICTDSMKAGHRKLDEGTAQDFFTVQDSIEKEHGYKPNEYVAFVCDRTGRTFYSHNLLGRLLRIRRPK